MIRRFFTAALAPVFVFTATLLPAAPAVPLVNLVDEQALFAISVTDVPALLRGWDASAFASTWNDPQVAKFIAPLRAEMKIDEWDAKTRAATGLSVRELLALAEGEALFAMPSFDFSKLESDDAPPFLIAIEVGEQADKIRKILADSLAEENLSEETAEFSGVQVHTRPQTKRADTDDSDDMDAAAKAKEPATVSWAIVDGVWLVSAEKQRVFATIDAIQQGGVGAALGKSERFLRTRQRTGDSQLLFYVNLPAIYPAMRDAVVLAKAKAKDAGTRNPMGFDPETMFAALGLDALGECFVGFRLDEKESRIDAGLLYSEERGLLKLLAYQPGPAARPDWIPAKWPNVSIASFSVPKAYEGLEELFNGINPSMYAGVQAQISALNKTLRIDLKRDLIGSIGDVLISAHAVPPGVAAGATPSITEMDQLIAVSLSNEAAFSKSIEAIKNVAGPIIDQVLTKRDYLGHALHTFTPPQRQEGQAVRGFSYAIANGMLLVGIGSPATVENALQGMVANEGLFWKRDDVQAALADVPADASGIQVQDLRVMIASFVQAAVEIQENMDAQDTDGDRKVFLDLSARPDAEVIARHWGMSTNYFIRTSDGLFSTTRFAQPQK